MRTVLSRLFLVGLLGVAIFAVIRFADGTGRAVVDLTSPDVDDLEHEAFRIDAPGTFAVDAAGSYEEVSGGPSDTTLAAYGWLVRRSDGAIVWKLSGRRPERGTLVTVNDTIRLGPGTYDAYFTAYGDPLVRQPGPRDGSLGERIRAFLSRGGRSWVGDAGRWRLILRGLDAPAREAETGGLGDPAEADAPEDSTFLWQALGVRSRQRREEILHVTAPARVAVRTVTEITDGVVADRASIVRLGGRDTVWTVPARGTWAGGSLKNRIVEDEVELQPGLYRVAFEADRSHAYGDWTANPPLVPWSWGVSVRRATPDQAVARLDPSALDLPQIAAFDCVGSDQELEAVFTTAQPLDVLLVAVGEITSGSRYDYATLEVEGEDGDWDEVWEMRDDLEPAGGDDKNKRATAALSLDPGTYRLLYETDGSHDCSDGYNGGGGPDEPLWGAVLYALDPDLDVASLDVQVVEPSEPVSSGGALALPDAGRLLARIDSVGNDEDHRVTFQLDAGTEVLVVAQGEMSDEVEYDFARIETTSGREVWRMSWQNTVPAGDAFFHRRFEGTVPLAPGTYVLHYESDGSRSFGDFGPSSDVLWGAHVYAPDAPAPEAPAADTPMPPPPPAPPAPAPETPTSDV
ncbi:hypothetical protein [Rubrivirga marina]|uniref:Uncharacterized protein n=1 Tax=Rubrivirga marina TaxID=1196024 RepID=A0A271J0Q1_9BACT|nr:hypothetical protein [Rubrivirga marina]PAP76887.1 hypothetical protein BSZ37_10805 [Rubrivirga marina]